MIDTVHAFRNAGPMAELNEGTPGLLSGELYFRSRQDHAARVLPAGITEWLSASAPANSAEAGCQQVLVHTARNTHTHTHTYPYTHLRISAHKQ